jgi:hypothetical protein
MRVERLETWAGPGQNEVLSVNLRALRADVVVLRRVQNQHTVLLGELSTDVSRLKADVAVIKDDVAVLKGDVAELKADVSSLKLAVQEILRRLPPAPAA